MTERANSDDAERRSALLRRWRQRICRSVRIPMMPKGVEHKQFAAKTLRGCLVRIPMMPKGVEHSDWRNFWQRNFQVRIPMMPKGVEHFWPLAIRRWNADVRIPMMPKGVEHDYYHMDILALPKCEFR